MRQRLPKYCSGFIPIQLIVTVFLVLTLAASTAIVVNPSSRFKLQQLAKPINPTNDLHLPDEDTQVIEQVKDLQKNYAKSKDKRDDYQLDDMDDIELSSGQQQLPNSPVTPPADPPNSDTTGITNQKTLLNCESEGGEFIGGGCRFPDPQPGIAAVSNPPGTGGEIKLDNQPPEQKKYICEEEIGGTLINSRCVNNKSVITPTARIMTGADNNTPSETDNGKGYCIFQGGNGATYAIGGGQSVDGGAGGVRACNPQTGKLQPCAELMNQYSSLGNCQAPTYRPSYLANPGTGTDSQTIDAGCQSGGLLISDGSYAVGESGFQECQNGTLTDAPIIDQLANFYIDPFNTTAYADIKEFCKNHNGSNCDNDPKTFIQNFLSQISPGYTEEIDKLKQQNEARLAWAQSEEGQRQLAWEQHREWEQQPEKHIKDLRQLALELHRREEQESYNQENYDLFRQASGWEPVDQELIDDCNAAAKRTKKRGSPSAIDCSDPTGQQIYAQIRLKALDPALARAAIISNPLIEAKLANCRKTIANGDCIVDPATSEVVPINFTLFQIKTENIGENTIYSMSTGATILSKPCGGLGSPQCDSLDFDESQGCNTGLSLDPNGNCSINPGFINGQALAQTIRQEAAANNGLVDPDFITALIAFNPQGAAYLPQIPTDYCGDSPGACVYSETEQKFITITGNDDRLNQAYYSLLTDFTANSGINPYANAPGNLGRECKKKYWSSLKGTACNNEMLECVDGGTCEISADSLNGLAAKAISGSDYGNFELNTSFFAPSSLNNNKDLAKSGCTDSKSVYIQNGSAWICWDATNKIISQAPSLEYANNPQLTEALFANVRDAVEPGKQIFAPCPKGYILLEDICVDPKVAAFDDNYSQGMVASAIRNDLPVNKMPIPNFLVDHLIAPIFAAIPGSSYYRAAQGQAEVAEILLQNRPEYVSADEILNSISANGRVYTHIDTANAMLDNKTLPNLFNLEEKILATYRNLAYTSLFTSAWTEGLLGAEQNTFYNYAQTNAQLNAQFQNSQAVPDWVENWVRVWNPQSLTAAAPFGAEITFTIGDLVVGPILDTTALMKIPGKKLSAAIPEAILENVFPVIPSIKIGVDLARAGRNAIEGIIADQNLGRLFNATVMDSGNIARVAPDVIPDAAKTLPPPATVLDIGQVPETGGNLAPKAADEILAPPAQIIDEGSIPDTGGNLADKAAKTISLPLAKGGEQSLSLSQIQGGIRISPAQNQAIEVYDQTSGWMAIKADEVIPDGGRIRLNNADDDIYTVSTNCSVCLINETKFETLVVPGTATGWEQAKHALARALDRDDPILKRIAIDLAENGRNIKDVPNTELIPLLLKEGYPPYKIRPETADTLTKYFDEQITIDPILTEAQLASSRKMMPASLQVPIIEKFRQTGSTAGVEVIKLPNSRFLGLVMQKNPLLTTQAAEDLFSSLTSAIMRKSDGSLHYFPKESGHAVMVHTGVDQADTIRFLADFSQKDAPEIIRQVLGKHGITANLDEINLTDYFWFGVGDNLPNGFQYRLIHGHAINFGGPSASTGAILGMAGKNIPGELKTAGHLPIIVENWNKNTQSIIIPGKDTPIPAAIITIDDLTNLPPPRPKTTASQVDLNQLSYQEKKLLANITMDYYSPKEIIDMLKGNTAILGDEAITIALKDDQIGSVQLAILSNDLSPYSKISTLMKSLFGKVDDYPRYERGLADLMVNHQANNAKIFIEKYGAKVGEFGGDGFKIIIPEKITPAMLYDMVDMSRSFNKELKLALAGKYGPDAALAARFIQENFDDLYLKIGVDKINSNLKLNDGAYRAIVLETDTPIDDLLLRNKNYRKILEKNPPAMMNIGPELAAQFGNRKFDLWRAGVKLVHTQDYGDFLVFTWDRQLRETIKDWWTDLSLPRSAAKLTPAEPLSLRILPPQAAEWLDIKISQAKVRISEFIEDYLNPSRLDNAQPAIPATNNNIINDQKFLETMAAAKQTILESDEPGIAMKTLDPIIDDLIANGENEAEAITQVVVKVAPPFSDNDELEPFLELADQLSNRGTIEEKLSCTAMVCLNYSTLTSQIIYERGKLPYLAEYAFVNPITREQLPKAGHMVAAMGLPDGRVAFLDLSRSGRVYYSIEDFIGFNKNFTLEIQMYPVKFSQSGDLIIDDFNFLPLNWNTKLKSENGIIMIDLTVDEIPKDLNPIEVLIKPGKANHSIPLGTPDNSFVLGGGDNADILVPGSKRMAASIFIDPQGVWIGQFEDFENIATVTVNNVTLDNNVKLIPGDIVNIDGQELTFLGTKTQTEAGQEITVPVFAKKSDLGQTASELLQPSTSWWSKLSRPKAILSAGGATIATVVTAAFAIAWYNLANVPVLNQVIPPAPTPPAIIRPLPAPPGTTPLPPKSQPELYDDQITESEAATTGNDKILLAAEFEQAVREFYTSGQPQTGDSFLQFMQEYFSEYKDDPNFMRMLKFAARGYGYEDGKPLTCIYGYAFFSGIPESNLPIITAYPLQLVPGEGWYSIEYLVRDYGGNGKKVFQQEFFNNQARVNLKLDIQGNTLYRFIDDPDGNYQATDLLYPGDALFYQEHVLALMDVYETPNGSRLFVIADSNSPQSGTTGLPEIKLLTEDELLDLFNGNLNQVAVMRQYGYDDGSRDPFINTYTNDFTPTDVQPATEEILALIDK